ncbi:hypothetical protein DUNSADRAFT_7262 [Dunaliella salina]|uniref:Uncharacterized protein n=1 Tax=Dunaliella salina TaxID=3046 RepID=A0ABQ7GLN3_DUNSA|nr:hypothetical protein DUNSADRAFT_7262 [Dunaliella salina]|eukprot:KAF5835522.1 hypothetical protein DUNSADRAFT_7262 [Dunaliella salina]
MRLDFALNLAASQRHLGVCQLLLSSGSSGPDLGNVGACQLLLSSCGTRLGLDDVESDQDKEWLQGALGEQEQAHMNNKGAEKAMSQAASQAGYSEDEEEEEVIEDDGGESGEDELGQSLGATLERRSYERQSPNASWSAPTSPSPTAMDPPHGATVAATTQSRTFPPPQQHLSMPGQGVVHLPTGSRRAHPMYVRHQAREPYVPSMGPAPHARGTRSSLIGAGSLRNSLPILNTGRTAPASAGPHSPARSSMSGSVSPVNGTAASVQSGSINMQRAPRGGPMRPVMSAQPRSAMYSAVPRGATRPYSTNTFHAPSPGLPVGPSLDAPLGSANGAGSNGWTLHAFSYRGMQEGLLLDRDTCLNCPNMKFAAALCDEPLGSTACMLSRLFEQLPARYVCHSSIGRTPWLSFCRHAFQVYWMDLLVQLLRAHFPNSFHYCRHALFAAAVLDKPLGCFYNQHAATALLDRPLGSAPYLHTSQIVPTTANTLCAAGLKDSTSYGRHASCATGSISYNASMLCVPQTTWLSCCLHTFWIVPTTADTLRVPQVYWMDPLAQLLRRAQQEAEDSKGEAAPPSAAVSPQQEAEDSKGKAAPPSAAVSPQQEAEDSKGEASPPSAAVSPQAHLVGKLLLGAHLVGKLLPGVGGMDAPQYGRIAPVTIDDAATIELSKPAMRCLRQTSPAAALLHSCTRPSAPNAKLLADLVPGMGSNQALVSATSLAVPLCAVLGILKALPLCAVLGISEAMPLCVMLGILKLQDSALWGGCTRQCEQSSHDGGHAMLALFESRAETLFTLTGIHAREGTEPGSLAKKDLHVDLFPLPLHSFH